MYELILFQHSVAKDSEVLTDTRLQNVLMKMPAWLRLAISPGILVYGVLLRHPVMIITVPLSISGLVSGSHGLIRWVLTLHYLVTMFSLTEYFSYFMQLERRGPQKSSHYKIDMTEKTISASYCPNLISN